MHKPVSAMSIDELGTAQATYMTRCLAEASARLGFSVGSAREARRLLERRDGAVHSWLDAACEYEGEHGVVEGYTCDGRCETRWGTDVS